MEKRLQVFYRGTHGAGEAELETVLADSVCILFRGEKLRVGKAMLLKQNPENTVLLEHLNFSTRIKSDLPHTYKNHCFNCKTILYKDYDLCGTCGWTVCPDCQACDCNRTG